MIMKKRLFDIILLSLVLLLPLSGFTPFAAEDSDSQVSSSSLTLSQTTPPPQPSDDPENIILDSNGQPLKPDGIETGEALGDSGETDDGMSFRRNPFFEMGLRSRTALPWHMVIICLAGIIIPVLGCFVMFRCEPNRAASMLLASDLICLIYNATYFLYLNTTGLDEAVLAMKMNFLSNILFYLFYILFMLYYLGKNPAFLPSRYPYRHSV